MTTPSPARRWGLPILLMALTFLSTFYVGSLRVLERTPENLHDLLAGWVFSVPLMAILMAHEFGHFIAGVRHKVDISPPYFIPVPFFFLGTMGAVIQMRERIRSRNALLDIGAAGPLAGMCVALPVVIYGLYTSPVELLPESNYIIEGRSPLYLALIALTKGPIPEGYDVMLNPTALAGWAGLLVTMINMLPFGQLDGGHVAYALIGPRQDRVSRWVLRLLPVLALLVSLAYALPSYFAGEPTEQISANAQSGVQWLVWAGLLYVMSRFTGFEHPPTEDHELSPKRRIIAAFTLSLFVLLFMPVWARFVP